MEVSHRACKTLKAATMRSCAGGSQNGWAVEHERLGAI